MCKKTHDKLESVFQVQTPLFSNDFAIIRNYDKIHFLSVLLVLVCDSFTHVVCFIVITTKVSIQLGFKHVVVEFLLFITRLLGQINEKANTRTDSSVYQSLTRFYLVERFSASSF